MTRKVYVGNLNYDTAEGTLQTLFSEYGEVQAVNIITDRYTGRSKGFGFVEMGTEEAAASAIEALNGQAVDGRNLRVDKAKPRTNRDRGGWGPPRW